MNPPTATVEKRPRRSLAPLVPLLVLVALGWFVTKNLSERGTAITIEFTAGQGIGVGDSVRYLGIDIGTVEEVALNEAGDGVVVRAELERFAEELARSGTRFWVVRPRVGFDGLGGLDTLIGARYIDTLPGPTDAEPQHAFRGLEDPPIQVPDGALELMLVADHVGGLNPGAPVMWKRIEVGRVLSVGLSSDARTIQARVAIDPEYTALVLSTSHFYRNTGLDLEVGIGGMKLQVDSLKSLFTGGVAFATPEEPAAPARMGQRFDLANEPKDEWLEWQPALQIQQASDSPTLARPTPTKALLRYKGGLLSRTKKSDGWTLWTERGLLGPASVLNVPEEGVEDAALEVSGRAFSPAVSEVETGLALLARISAPPGSGTPWPSSRCRTLTDPEDLLLFADPNVTAVAVDAVSLIAPSADLSDEVALPIVNWSLVDTVPIGSEWHGAAVIARSDGALVGMVVLSGERAELAPLPAALVD